MRDIRRLLFYDKFREDIVKFKVEMELCVIKKKGDVKFYLFSREFFIMREKELLFYVKFREDIVKFKVEVKLWKVKKDDVKFYLFSREFFIQDKFKEDIVKFKVEILM